MLLNGEKRSVGEYFKDMAFEAGQVTLSAGLTAMATAGGTGVGFMGSLVGALAAQPIVGAIPHGAMSNVMYAGIVLGAITTGGLTLLRSLECRDEAHAKRDLKKALQGIPYTDEIRNLEIDGLVLTQHKGQPRILRDKGQESIGKVAVKDLLEGNTFVNSRIRTEVHSFIEKHSSPGGILDKGNHKDLLSSPKATDELASRMVSSLFQPNNKPEPLSLKPR